MIKTIKSIFLLITLYQMTYSFLGHLAMQKRGMYAKKVRENKSLVEIRVS